jgi:serine/threonine-protein kinase RsbW
MGVYGQAVTNHTFSQRTAHKFGFRDCAIFLGLIPSSIVFRGIRDRLEQRESLCAHFRYLDQPESVAIYPSARHADMVKRLYENLGARPTIMTEAPEPPREAEGDAVVETSSYRVLNAAKIEVRRPGAGAAEQVESALTDLRLKRIDQVTLWLNLQDPRTAALTEAVERLGFFFAGILPGGVEGGDAIILQYLNNVPLDFSRIQLVSETADALLEYIRESSGRHGPRPRAG